MSFYINKMLVLVVLFLVYRGVDTSVISTGSTEAGTFTISTVAASSLTGYNIPITITAINRTS